MYIWLIEALIFRNRVFKILRQNYQCMHCKNMHTMCNMMTFHNTLGAISNALSNHVEFQFTRRYKSVTNQISFWITNSGYVPRTPTLFASFLGAYWTTAMKRNKRYSDIAETGNTFVYTIETRTLGYAFKHLQGRVG